MDNRSFNKADELGRRQFMVNAARSYLGVSLAPMLGAGLAGSAFGQSMWVVRKLNTSFSLIWVVV